jgi:anti-anti-sigma factor
MLRRELDVRREEGVVVIEVTRIGAWASVVLAGDFDVHNAAEISGVAADLARTVVEVTMDLSRVTSLDAGAISALAAADRLISATGRRLTLVGVSLLTRERLDQAGVRASLPIAPDVLALALIGAGDSEGTGPRATEGATPADVDEELQWLLAEVSRLLLTEPTVTGDLQTLARAAVELVPDCTAASIALMVLGEPRTAAVSGPVAVEIDLAQYESGQGPCLLAAGTSTRIRVATLESDNRFGVFAARVGSLGLGGVLSIPVVVGDVTIGSVNLYSSGEFPPAADAAGEVIGAQVGAALVKSEIYGAAQTLARRVQDRTDAETSVNIAAGVLAGFEQCSIDQARRLLRSAAASTGDSLAVTARRVIDFLVERGPIPS